MLKLPRYYGISNIFTDDIILLYLAQMERTIIGVDGGLLWWVVVIGLLLMNFFIAVIEQKTKLEFF